MNKQELTQMVKNAEVAAQTGINLILRYKDEDSDYQRGQRNAYRDVATWIEEFDEQTKGTVPKFAADWIEQCKENATLADCLNGYYQISNGEVVGSTDFQNWVADNENDELTAKAWMFGYEVEKEPLFLMPVPYVPYPVHYCVDEDGKVSYRQGNAQKFTQEELDKHFPEIKQFAVPVPVEEDK